MTEWPSEDAGRCTGACQPDHSRVRGHQFVFVPIAECREGRRVRCRDKEVHMVGAHSDIDKPVIHLDEVQALGVAPTECPLLRLLTGKELMSVAGWTADMWGRDQPGEILDDAVLTDLAGNVFRRSP